MASIMDLPEEIVLEVMSYLTLADRKNTRMVCQKWHRLSYDRKLIKEDWTHIMASEYLNHKSAISRHFNVMVHEDDNLMETMPFWEKHGKEIKVIDFRDIKGDNQAMSHVLRSCPNVDHIIMTLTKPASFNANISFPVVPLPHLERLELRKHDCDRKMFEQTPKLKELFTAASGTYGSLELIEKHSTTLEELSLGHLSNKAQLMRIIEIVDAQLIKLHLDDDYFLTNSCLNAIVKKFVNLKHLSLTHCRFSTSALGNAVTSLKHLTHLSLYGYNLTEACHSFFVAIDNLTRLIGIDLRETGILDEDLIIAFRSPHPELINLKLDGTGANDDFADSLYDVCPNCPNLLALGLYSCRLKDSHLRAIARNNTKLEELSLVKSHGWESATTILNEIETLKHLSLANLRKRAAVVRALSLPKLRTIDLGYATITSTDVLQLVQTNRLLYEVEVRNTEGMALIYKNVLSNEIQSILERRRPSNPCRRQENIFNF